jgi:DNA excision repair protein ERCC-4
LIVGDYSVAGLEDRCVVERKALPDLVHSLTVNRPIFINRLRRICSYPHRLLVITATLSQVKTGYPYSAANPNHIFQSAIALLAGLTVPFVCADNEALGEELVASYLYQVHLYHWLEANDYGRFLADGDL